MGHPLFPRVVVYLWKTGPGRYDPVRYDVAVTVQSYPGGPWVTVVRDKGSSATEARGIAHLLGRAWEKRAGAPGQYELVHGESPETRGAYGSRRQWSRRGR